MGTIRPELRSSVIVFHASARADRGWEKSKKLLMLAPGVYRKRFDISALLTADFA
jgi:hypothetical protein